MGLPALKHDAPVQRARPHLATVPSGARGPVERASARGQAAATLRHRELFTAFAVAAVLLSLLGVARVAVTARAAATSIESARIRKAIKAERLEGDLLEIQQSSLATPGRIQEIAGTTMRMSEAGGVCYIQLDGTEVCVPSAATTSVATAETVGAGAHRAGPRSGMHPGVVTSVLRAALGEAQLLLLGDVALASSR